MLAGIPCLPAAGFRLIMFIFWGERGRNDACVLFLNTAFAISAGIHYFYYMEKFRKLTPHDLAFGIGRKATDEELRELVSRPRTGKRKTAQEVLDEVTKRLADKDIKKAS